jgi:phage terminase large subunit-like protein
MTTLSQQTLQRWRRNPISFIEQCLCDPETGKPFKLLDAERRFLAHAFQLSDDGRLLYPEQVYSCPRKSGKTTFAAIHALTTTLLFGGRYPEATICANDLEQARGRVFEMMKRIVE